MKPSNQRGFVPLILAIVIGLVAAGFIGYRYASQPKAAPVVVEPTVPVEAPAAAPEVVEVKPAPVVTVERPAEAPAPEKSAAPVAPPVVSARPKAVPKVETPTVAAPVAPVTVPAAAPIVAPDDTQERLAALLTRLAADRDGWTRYSEDAAGRRANALRALANNVTPPTYSGAQASFDGLKSLIQSDAAYYDDVKAGARARYAALYSSIEAAIRSATAFDAKYEGYLDKANAAATGAENAAANGYASDLAGIGKNLTIYETEERANQLLATARSAGTPVVPRP